MRLVLAPNWFAVTTRSLSLLGAMLLVAAVMLGAKRPPQLNREVRRDGIARFSPRLLPGIAKLGGEMLLVVALTWTCRGPLKIRL